MNYLSVCSGIEAATRAWHEIGFNPVGFSEIEPFPAAVLAHHYPQVPNYGDMIRYKDWNLDPNSVDLLVGGTPCQSFSVAGLRKGLDDPRGNLALVYCGMLDHFRPKWFVWENVPGVLSSNGGRDFGAFLGAVAELGYGFSYRVLDAQYFGVAQRRRRVFVVGHLGDWRPAAAVLFERESLCRDTAPRREAGKGITHATAPCLTSSGRGVDRTGDTRGQDPVVAVELDVEICGTLTAGFGKVGAPEVDAYTCIPAYGIPGNRIGRKPENGGNAVEPMHDVSPCLTKTDRHGVAQPMPINTMIATRHNALGRGTGFGIGEPGDPAYTLIKGHSHAVAHNMAVRRLTPVECERLQGFPDNYTNIPWRKKEESPDGPRYKALGNSMAVPVMNWIGKRIREVSKCV